MATRWSARSRAAVCARLRGRREEIEQAVLARVRAVADPMALDDPAYAEGLRTAVSAALDYGLAAIEHGEERVPPPPPALLVQARVAARSGVELETVLRRYLAGYSLLNDFLVEEGERAQMEGAVLGRLLRTQAILFDRLLATISEEHGREVDKRPGGSGQRRAERVRRLLDGEPLDTAELAYDFEAHHVAIVATGAGTAPLLRSFAASLDRRLLLIRPEERAVWAWLGGRRPIDPGELRSRISSELPTRSALAIGEPGRGLSGWRLTYRQARAAMAIARRRPGSPVRYADVALLVALLRDDLLATSLHQIYLAPLDAQHDGGKAAREILRAYFAAGRNVTSAAAALGLNRNTVAARLRAIEKRLDRSLRSCGPELEAALRLHEIPPLVPQAVR